MDVALREAELAGELRDAARRLALGERFEHFEAFDEGLVHVLIYGTMFGIVGRSTMPVKRGLS
jgi:hypothetical protein